MKLLQELKNTEKHEDLDNDLPVIGDYENDDGLNKDELLKEFYKVYKEKEESYSKASDSSSINADFIGFLKSKGITCKIVTGKIELDNPDLSEKDFTEKQLDFISRHGYDISKRDDLMKFCIRNNYFDKVKLTSHSWIQVNGLILDPAGKYLFKDTGKAKDLNDDRYNEGKA